MIQGLVQTPKIGCIVELLHNNKTTQAYVLEADGSKVRLMLATRRELSVPVNRLLPWLGPVDSGNSSDHQAIVDILETCQKQRETKALLFNLPELWEIIQGEEEQVSALWMAELALSEPDIDDVAAIGHLLLNDKKHFRFAAPLFEVYSADHVEQKSLEEDKQRSQESFIQGAQALFLLLWEQYSKNKKLNASALAAIDPLVAEKMQELLFAQIAENDDDKVHKALWTQITTALPNTATTDVFLAFHLAVAWGIIEEHHNIWLTKAGYDPGNEWSAPFADAMVAFLQQRKAHPLPVIDKPFISIDSATTKDIDDALFLDPATDVLQDGSLKVHVALACPAYMWEFGSELDKAVSTRATSIYLPETTCHMLPEELGTQGCSLVAGKEHESMVVTLHFSAEAELLDCAVAVGRVCVKHNATYNMVEDALNAHDAGNRAADAVMEPYVPALVLLDKLVQQLQANRLANGAVLIEREEPEIVVQEQGEHVVVDIHPIECLPRSQLLVSELMIATNMGIARWAQERSMPLLHRTQDITVPKDFSGIWTRPEEIAHVVRALVPACLDVEPKRHAALGITGYAPSTSPLRRYPDFVNQGQILQYLDSQTIRWDKDTMLNMLSHISIHLSAATQVQRFRPRYWKLVYFKQQGDKKWWDACIAEENDAFVSVVLVNQQLQIRCRRTMFSEKAYAGQSIAVRIGKVRPLHNEIQVIAVEEQD